MIHEPIRILSGWDSIIPSSWIICLSPTFFADRSERRDGDPVSTIELGLRSQNNPWSVFTIGFGTGFGDDREAPELKANLGCQMGF